jgi:hypothetical protein
VASSLSRAHASAGVRDYPAVWKSVCLNPTAKVLPARFVSGLPTGCSEHQQVGARESNSVAPKEMPTLETERRVTQEIGEDRRDVHR